MLPYRHPVLHSLNPHERLHLDLVMPDKFKKMIDRASDNDPEMIGKLRNLRNCDHGGQKLAEEKYLCILTSFRTSCKYNNPSENLKTSGPLGRSERFVRNRKQAQKSA